MNRTTGRKRGALVALALSGGLLLSACSTQQIGAAAVIDGEPLSISTLQDTTQSLVEAGGVEEVPEGDIQRITLTRYIVSGVIEKAAEKAGVTVSQGDVDLQRATIEQALGGEEQMEQGLIAQGIAPDYIDEFVRDVALQEALGQALVPGDEAMVAEQRSAALNAALVEASVGLDVEVNPRFGVWEAEQGNVTPQISGGLARTPEEWLGVDPTTPELGDPDQSPR